MDQYFTRISEIIKKGKIPLKIKFMLQDIQDLRANDWISRLGQEQTIKTINQVSFMKVAVMMHVMRCIGSKFFCLGKI